MSSLSFEFRPGPVDASALGIPELPGKASVGTAGNIKHKVSLIFSGESPNGEQEQQIFHVYGKATSTTATIHSCVPSRLGRCPFHSSESLGIW